MKESAQTRWSLYKYTIDTAIDTYYMTSLVSICQQEWLTLALCKFYRSLDILLCKIFHQPSSDPLIGLSVPWLTCFHTLTIICVGGDELVIPQRRHLRHPDFCPRCAQCHPPHRRCSPKTTALVSRVVYSIHRIHFIDSVYAVYAQLFSPSYTLGVASSDLPWIYHLHSVQSTMVNAQYLCNAKE